MDEAIRCAAELDSGQESVEMESGWILAAHDYLRPGDAFAASCGGWYARHVEDDIAIRFIFHDKFKAGHVLIHASRLKWAGGRLAALVTRDFVERTEKTVRLCIHDTPFAFDVIRDYLYLTHIWFVGASEHMRQSVRVAHNWGLMGLVRLLCRSNSFRSSFESVTDLRSGRDIFVLPGIPDKSKEFFWESVAILFDTFKPEAGINAGVLSASALLDTDDSISAVNSRDAIQSKTCPFFPRIMGIGFLSRSSTEVDEGD